MSFLIKDEKLLTKNNKIWSESKKMIVTHFLSINISRPKYKTCNNKITTNFHCKAPKERIKSVCLSAIAIESVFQSSKKIFHIHF